jgi:hypothetical protein
MEVLREQMSFLLEQGLYDSAELLGCFLMCATTANSEILPSVRAENMVLLADALYGKKEYRRALVSTAISLLYTLSSISICLSLSLCLSVANRKYEEVWVAEYVQASTTAMSCKSKASYGWNQDTCAVKATCCQPNSLFQYK